MLRTATPRLRSRDLSPPGGGGGDSNGQTHTFRFSHCFGGRGRAAAASVSEVQENTGIRHPSGATAIASGAATRAFEQHRRIRRPPGRPGSRIAQTSTVAPVLPADPSASAALRAHKSRAGWPEVAYSGGSILARMLHARSAEHDMRFAPLVGCPPFWEGKQQAPSALRLRLGEVKIVTRSGPSWADAMPCRGRVMAARAADLARKFSSIVISKVKGGGGFGRGRCACGAWSGKRKRGPRPPRAVRGPHENSKGGRSRSGRPQS